MGKDAEMFFFMLASNDDSKKVDLYKFIQACMAPKGIATSLDLNLVRFEQKAVISQIRKIKAMLRHVCDQLVDVRDLEPDVTALVSDRAEMPTAKLTPWVPACVTPSA